MKLKNNHNYIIIALIIACILLFIVIKNKKNIDAFTNIFTINDIYLYIFSWKRVSDNAINVYNIVSRVFPNTYFINCDENFDATKYIPAEKLIEKDDSFYFGGQFETGIQHCPNGKIYGNIVGDVEADKVDWNQMAKSLLYAMNTLNAGVFAPFVPNYPHNGEHIEGSYHIVENTDETVFFIHPDLYGKYKNFPYNKETKFGYGIDIHFCNLSEKIGKKTIRDTSIQVDTINSTTGYNNSDAVKQMHNFFDKISNYSE
jgi:hypothetical protein